MLSHYSNFMIILAELIYSARILKSDIYEKDNNIFVDFYMLLVSQNIPLRTRKEFFTP